MELCSDLPADIAHMLVSGEVMEHHLEKIEMVIAVTDQRIIVRDDHRVALDLPIDGTGARGRRLPDRQR